MAGFLPTARVLLREDANRFYQVLVPGFLQSVLNERSVLILRVNYRHCAFDFSVVLMCPVECFDNCSLRTVDGIKIRMGDV